MNKATEKYKGIFDKYMVEDNPERWGGPNNEMDFPNLMWNLGFDMDAYSSFNELYGTPPSYPYDGYEYQDWVIARLKESEAQIVGNYIFSRYRHLTHWCDYGYHEYQAGYFFRQAFPVLEQKMIAGGVIRKPYKKHAPASDNLTSFEIEWLENGLADQQNVWRERFTMYRKDSRISLVRYGGGGHVLEKAETTAPRSEIIKLFDMIEHLDKNSVWAQNTPSEILDGSRWIMRLRYGNLQKCFEGNCYALPAKGDTIIAAILDILDESNFEKTPLLFGF